MMTTALPLILVATVPLVPGPVLAQGSRELHDQIRVRVDVPGLDSTTWFTADFRHTVEGCELVQLREVSWVNGQARLGVDVPMNDRAVVEPRRVREIQTRATDRSEWSPVDVAWFRDRGGPAC